MCYALESINGNFRLIFALFFKFSNYITIAESSNVHYFKQMFKKYVCLIVLPFKKKLLNFKNTITEFLLT